MIVRALGVIVWAAGAERRFTRRVMAAKCVPSLAKSPRPSFSRHLRCSKRALVGDKCPPSDCLLAPFHPSFHGAFRVSLRTVGARGLERPSTALTPLVGN